MSPTLKIKHKICYKWEKKCNFAARIRECPVDIRAEWWVNGFCPFRRLKNEFIEPTLTINCSLVPTRCSPKYSFPPRILDTTHPRKSSYNITNKAHTKKVMVSTSNIAISLSTSSSNQSTDTLIGQSSTFTFQKLRHTKISQDSIAKWKIKDTKSHSVLFLKHTSTN